METHKGLLVKFARKENETDKEYLKRFLKEQFKEEAWKEDIQDYIYDHDEHYEKIIYWKNTIYSNENHQQLNDDIDVFQETEQGIEYLTSFYNGGTCLTEVLEEGLERINKNKQ